MHKKLIAIIVILSLIYPNLLYALTNNSELKSTSFRGLIRPLALVSQLFEKRTPSPEDLLLIKAALCEFLELEQVDGVTLVYNKDRKELFIYDRTSLIHMSAERLRTCEKVGRVYIARHKFTEELERKIRKGAIILEPGQKTETLRLPARLLSPLYLRTRFWLGLAFLSIATLTGLIIYACYSILEDLVDLIQRRRLNDVEFQQWIEYRRHWLLNFAIPLLRVFPFLRVELWDVILRAPPPILAQPETYSAKSIHHEKVLDIIKRRHKSVPRDKEWEEAKIQLRGILEELGEPDLLQLLEETPIYLIGPGPDVNSPFIFYDKKTNSYIFTFATGEPPRRMRRLTGRIRRFISGGSPRLLITGEFPVPGKPDKPVIYISQVFYEQLKTKRPLVTMLLAEALMQLSQIPQEKIDQIRSRIKALDATGITLDHAKTIIKNAYFFREREPAPIEWSHGTIRQWLRNKILQVIIWSQRFYNWFHFMKAFISEFFTITQNWIRTPFIYPLRSNLHCGIPTPDRPLPEYGTYLWTIQSGFSDEAARIIGEADVCTDKITSGWIPRLGDQSRHYNMYLHNNNFRRLRDSVSGDISQIERVFSDNNYDPQPQFTTRTDIELPPDEKWSEVNYPDSRLDWAQYELERAGYYYSIGEKKLALECLGRGLHSLQDLIAHGDFDAGPFGTRIHPPELDNPLYDPDPTGRLVYSGKMLRLKETERLTKSYLELAKKRFQKIDEKLSRRYYPEQGYLEMTANSLTRRYYVEGPKKGTVETLIATEWIRENMSFTYTKVRFKDGLHTRPSSTIAYVARILHALTGINITISRVDKYPFPAETASASRVLEELSLAAPYNSQILVTVDGDVAKEFLDRALEIIIARVLDEEIFNDIGISPKDTADTGHELYSEILHKKETILRLINELALDIKKAQEDKRPLAEEAMNQKIIIDTYLNLNLAELNGVIDAKDRDRLASLVYYFLTRLHEIRGEISTRPLRSITTEIPSEADKVLPDYTKEFFEYAVLTGLITDPLKWCGEFPRLLEKEYHLSPLRLQALNIWSQIVKSIREEHPDLSPTELREKVIECYYRTYGEFATRKLGNAELALDLAANGINLIQPLRERLKAVLSGLPLEGLASFHNYLTAVTQEQLSAARVVGLGLLTSGIPPPELRDLLLGKAPVDILTTLGVGESATSLAKTGRFKTTSSWQDIYEYVQSLIRTGIRPKRILVDLDMTVFTPKGYIGSIPWFDQRVREAGRYQTFWEWGDHERRMAENGFFHLVDPRIPEIIERLKAQGIEVVGFTARMWKKDSRRTRRILKRLGINFSRIAFVPGVYHYGGVIYTFGQGIHKAKALLRLTKGRDSETTVVIDDNITNIANILHNKELPGTYGVLYRSSILEELMMLKAPDYIRLGDRALTEGQSDIAQEYYMNAVEQTRYMTPPQKQSTLRQVWQRVARLDLLGKDTLELARFLVKWDETKHDLRIMDSRLKDPYLNLLVSNPPITDPERYRVISYEVTDSTDLANLKHVLRRIRDIRRKDGNPKFRIVLTGSLPAAHIRLRLKIAGLEEGINYDYWYAYKGNDTLTEADIITIRETDPAVSSSQLIYEGIARAEGCDTQIPPYTEVSQFSRVELVSIREEAKRKIEGLAGYEPGKPIEIYYHPSASGVAGAIIETKFLRKYLGPNLEIIYKPTQNRVTPIFLQTLNSEVLRQTKSLTSAALYLEETSRLAAFAIFMDNLESSWAEYLSGYGLDKIRLDELVDSILNTSSPEEAPERERALLTSV